MTRGLRSRQCHRAHRSPVSSKSATQTACLAAELAYRRFRPSRNLHWSDAAMSGRAAYMGTSCGASTSFSSGTWDRGHRPGVRCRTLQHRRYNGGRVELGARTPCPRACPAHSRGLNMTAAKMERSRKSLVKDFGDVLAEAETLLKQAAAETGERASDLRSQVEAKLMAAKLKLQDLQDDAVDRAKAAARVTDDYVRDNPWQAIGAAAAVGFLVGVLISRR